MCSKFTAQATWQQVVDFSQSSAGGAFGSARGLRRLPNRGGVYSAARILSTASIGIWPQPFNLSFPAAM